MAWAFATAGHAASALFRAISAEAVLRGLDGFSPQDLSNLAWAFAVSTPSSANRLFNVLSAELARRGLDAFNPHELSNMAWAFAVANPSSAHRLFGTARFTMRCAHLEASFSSEALRQLHQWSLWREERSARWPALPPYLRRSCRDAFSAPGLTTSRLQSDVVRYMRSHGVQVQEESFCEASGYSIDALVTLHDGTTIAVEVDGPSHFVGLSQQPTGATLLKHRQLRHFKWRLESVPYWDWHHGTELHWLPRVH